MVKQRGDSFNFTLDDGRVVVLVDAGRLIAELASNHIVVDSGLINAIINSGNLNAVVSGSVGITNNPLLVNQIKGTPTLTTPTIDASSKVILAANENRKRAIFVNGGTNTIFLRPNASAATISNSIPVAALGSFGNFFIDDFYTGEWRGITATLPGDVRVIEVV